MLTILQDFRADANGLAAIQQVRKARPDVYLKVLSMLVPKEHKVENIGALGSITDVQLDVMIAQMLERIEEQKKDMIDVTPPKKRKLRNKLADAMDAAIERDRGPAALRNHARTQFTEQFI